MHVELDDQVQLGHLMLKERECRVCGKEKNLLTDFYRSRKDPALASSYSYECKECTIKRTKDYYRGKHQDDEHKELLLSQNSSCAICGTRKPGGRWKTFSVDKDSTTGRVRGLLCKSCNIMIGESKNSIDTLKKAVLYLEQN